jgi:hypothetical protein
MFFCCTRFYRNKSPIFIEFPLLTSKKLDFQDFYVALQIKKPIYPMLIKRELYL